MRSKSDHVLSILAHHTGRRAPTIHASDELERDLDVTPLELVLVSLELEDHYEVELDVEGLESVRTVAEVLSFFTRAIARARHPRVDEVA